MKTPSVLRGDGPKCIGVLLLVLGLGWWFGVLLPMAICFGVVVLFIVAYFGVGYLAVTGRIKSSADLPESHLLNDGRHPSEWDALESQLIKVFMSHPEDRYGTVMLRFAVAINAVDADQQTVPSGMAGVILRKMLYEYWRRTGSLYFERYDERTAMSGLEVLRRLSDDERPRFLEFCRSLDTPSNVTPPAVKPDYPSTAEMAQR